MRRRTSDRPRIATRVLDGGLVVVAAAGLAVLVARLVGALLGLELVVFATGSMTPAYPQGAVAISQRTPLGAIRVGDVVTIDRAGRLPLTHRVVTVDVEGRRASVRLQGDANRRPDPAPYSVDHLSRVVLALPPALWPVRLLGTGQVQLAAVLLAALAVGWAMWPRTRPSPAPRAAPAA